MQFRNVHRNLSSLKGRCCRRALRGHWPPRPPWDSPEPQAASCPAAGPSHCEDQRLLARPWGNQLASTLTWWASMCWLLVWEGLAISHKAPGQRWERRVVAGKIRVCRCPPTLRPWFPETPASGGSVNRRRVGSFELPGILVVLNSFSSQHLIINQFLCKNFRAPFIDHGKINMIYRLTLGLYPMQGSMHSPKLLKIKMCSILRRKKIYLNVK